MGGNQRSHGIEVHGELILSLHESERDITLQELRAALAERGITVFNPIENAFAKPKSLLRMTAERTVGALWDRIGLAIDVFTATQCANYFAAAGYDAT